MSEFKVIPAIDILDGKVVRLTQGDYDRVDHYDYSPADCAKMYQDAGASHIHLVDLNGAREGKLVNEAVIREIRVAVDCTLDLGGGIRSLETAQSLFDLGLDYLVLGSLLIKDFDTSSTIINSFPNKIIAGLDAKANLLATEGWEETSSTDIHDFISTLANLPLHSIVYTDISKDGMLAGPNFEMLGSVAKGSPFPIIASGGVSSVADVQQLKKIDNLWGCIVGKAILSGKVSLQDLFA